MPTSLKVNINYIEKEVETSCICMGIMLNLNLINFKKVDISHIFISDFIRVRNKKKLGKRAT